MDRYDEIMDGKDKETLNRINRIASRTEGRNLIQKEDVHAQGRETLSRIYNDTRLPELARKKAKEMLDSPKLHQTRDTVNQEAAKKMENQVERNIKHAIETGHLSDPSKSVGDFMKRIQDADRRNNGSGS